jgi:hypothetical protein
MSGPPRTASSLQGVELGVPPVVVVEVALQSVCLKSKKEYKLTMEQDVDCSSGSSTVVGLAGSAPAVVFRRHGPTDEQHGAHAYNLDGSRGRVLQSCCSRNLDIDPGNLALGLDPAGGRFPSRTL